MVAKPTAAPALAPAEEEHVGKWTVLAIVALGVFMATLDSSVVNISLPTIARHFGRPLDTAVMWVVIAYLVVVASLMLTIGRLADVVGHKPIWLLGLAVFTIGSAVCGAAPSLASLIAFRSVQGVGGAMLMAISPAMLTAAFPPAE
jgi:MFS family permease